MLKMELFVAVANVCKLSSLVAKCSIIYFAGFVDPPLGKQSNNMSCFAELKHFLFCQISCSDDSTSRVCSLKQRVLGKIDYHNSRASQ